MTIEELNALKIGDKVYYYRVINCMSIGTVSAAIITKTVKTVYHSDIGPRISLEHGGVILNSVLHLFDIDKEKLLYRKIKDIKKKVNEATNGTHMLKYPNGLKRKLESILKQKNIQKMLEKYPEILI